MVDFKNCTLWISARSPFARRVRIALLERGIAYEEKAVNVFEPTREFLEASPLGRVPLVQFKAGGSLQESHVILQLLGGESRLEVLNGMTLASGVCEKVVEWYIDTTRPSKQRDPEIQRELDAVLARVLPSLEARIRERGGYLSPLDQGGELTQADIDWGCALTYLSLRYTRAWRERHPGLAQWVDRLETRGSFKATCPPAV